MVSRIDLDALRELVASAANAIAHAGPVRVVNESFAGVGLPAPPGGDTKTTMAQSSVEATPAEQLPEIARRILDRGDVAAGLRNALQDVLWAAEPAPEIPKRLRREIAGDLYLEPFLPGYSHFKAMLGGLFDLGVDPFGGMFGNDTSIGGQIDQHVQRNPGDWTAEALFDALGAFDASHRRFALLLEGMVCADVLLYEAVQRELVAVFNRHLNSVGLRLTETAERDGYPVFQLTSTRAHGGRPKNLFFASLGKPDLRLIDAIDNDIESVTGTDKVLVYNRAITSDGLRWRDLEAWWKQTQGLDSDAEAKKTLWRRLLQSLPESSPPQRNLFELFHEIHGERVYELPALMPEVWRHWDPVLAKARGAKAMVNLRMDFLMLLPGGHRIVLEVDGKHHYATDQRADPAVYAATMRGDRDLKLARYDVFRFGAAELIDKEPARVMLSAFFDDLFRTYHLA